MIEEPVDGNTPNAFHVWYAAAGAFSMLRLTDRKTENIWIITRFLTLGCIQDKFLYCIGHKGTTQERFIEYLSQSYPDYLEWLLFHPEWLR